MTRLGTAGPGMHTIMRSTALKTAGAAIALGIVGAGLGAGTAAGASPASDASAASVTGVDWSTAATETSATVVSASAAGDGRESLLEKADRYAAELQEEPFVADQASTDMYGGAFDELKQLQTDAGVATYIVFDHDLDYQQNTTIAQVLTELLPGDEFVVLVVGESAVGPTVEVVSPDESRELLLRQQFSSLSLSGAQSDSVLVRLRTGLERLADPQEVRYESSGNDSLRWLSWQISSSPLRSLMIAVAIIAVIATALWFLIPRGAKRRRYRIPKAVALAAAAADRGAMRRALGDDALDVVERLQKLQTEGLDPDTADLVEHGLDAYSVARRLADDEKSREDDLAGAMVLMGIAEAAVTHAETQAGGRSGGRSGGRAGGRSGDRSRFRLGAKTAAAGGSPKALCSVDPRHGPTKKTLEASVAGRVGTLTVPACAKCLHDASSDNPLQWLSVDGKPYVLRDTVWAKTLYGGTGDDLVDAVVAARAKAS